MPAKRQYFGTDGVRAVANTAAMTPEFVVRLGQAAASVLMPKAHATPNTRPVCIIGRDTRLSGDMLEAALTAGLNSAGVDVLLCGVIPTPAVAWMVMQEKAAFGAVVSASHNPFYDNGVKFIGHDGYKLSDEQELAIGVVTDLTEMPDPLDFGRGIGVVCRIGVVIHLVLLGAHRARSAGHGRADRSRRAVRSYALSDVNAYVTGQAPGH